MYNKCLKVQTIIEITIGICIIILLFNQLKKFLYQKNPQLNKFELGTVDFRKCLVEINYSATTSKGTCTFTALCKLRLAIYSPNTFGSCSNVIRLRSTSKPSFFRASAI